MARLPLLLASLLAFGLAGAPPAAAQGSCAWAAHFGGSQLNVLYPEETANYWILVLPALPPGGHLELAGRFPRARYLSLATYSRNLKPIDGLADYEIVPDAGSTNPFVADADRRTEQRAYTVRAVDGAPPESGREPNTVYNISPDGSTRSDPGTGIILRIYQPDRGVDATGGFGLPKATIVGAAGERTPLGDCAARDLPDAGLREALAYSGAGIDTPGPGGLARNPPKWRRHTTSATTIAGLAIDNQALGEAIADPVLAELTRTLPASGFGENPHSAYIATLTSAEFGQVLAFTGRAPRTPRTSLGQPVMGTGEMRFWSLCTNGQATNFYACANDDQIPLDANGDYLLALSSAAARPRNATAACGVAWVPTGPVAQSQLFVRHMLPDPAFPHSIHNAPADAEEAALGPYFPRGRYFRTAEDFEREVGCNPPAMPATRPDCVDRRRPRVTIRSIRLGGRRPRIRGRAHDHGCARLMRVDVTVRRHRGKRLHARVTGRRRWVARLGRRLPRGRYVVRARALDRAGNVAVKRRRA